MTDATAIALSAQASAQAAAAAEAARRAECIVLMPNYDAKTASVEQMRNYASCVNTLYGQMGPAGIQAIKYAIIVCLIGMVFGLYHQYKYGDGIIDYFFGALTGVLFAFCGCVVIGAIAFVLFA